MKLRFQIYLWLWGILLTALLAALLASSSNQIVAKYILLIMVLWLVANIIIEILFHIREKGYIKFVRDIDPRKIKILNDGYEIVEECFAQVNKLYVLGRNKSCQKIADGNWDYPLQWENNLQSVKIPNGNHVLLNVFDASDEKIVLLFQNMNLPLPIYKDFKNGNTARKGRYQLEIILFGNAKNKGGTDSIKKRSYWDIFYQSKGVGNLPTFKMQQIEKMREPTGNVMDEQFPNTTKFDLFLKK